MYPVVRDFQNEERERRHEEYLAPFFKSKPHIPRCSQTFEKGREEEWLEKVGKRHELYI
jgi:hypothetical protein